MLTRSCLVTFLIVGLFSPNAHAQFTPNIPYEDAVPAFVDEITTAVEDVENLEEIGVWAEETGERLPELLDELTVAIQEYSQQPFEENDIGQFEILSDKWWEIVAAYPEIENVAPLVEPILNEAIVGLPALRPHRYGADSPFQNFFELYRQLEIQNPWGVSTIFQLEPLPTTIQVASFDETARETTLEGVFSKFIIFQETLVTVNNEVIFHKIIVDNEVVVKEVNEVIDVTLFHEVVRKMKEDMVDPVLVSALEDLLALIDFHLEEAKMNGLVTLPDVVDQNYHSLQVMNGLLSSPMFLDLVSRILPEQSGLTARKLQSLVQPLQVKNDFRKTKTLPKPAPPGPVYGPERRKIIKKEAYKMEFLNEYDKSAINISNIWLSVIIAPLLMFLMYSLIKFALSPTLAIIRHKSNIPVR